MMAYRNGGTPTLGMQHLHQVIESLPYPCTAPMPCLGTAYFYLGMGYRTMDIESCPGVFQHPLTHLPTCQPASPRVR
jgi:hypothetical protein